MFYYPAIAALQINVFKRLIYMHIYRPVIFINPGLEFIGNEKIEVLDDCMSFPKLKVNVLYIKDVRYIIRTYPGRIVS